MSESADLLLLPDAGPLITLAYADALDLLFKPGWTVGLVDMVLEEVTRNRTPTSTKLQQWAEESALSVLSTQTFRQYGANVSDPVSPPKKSNLGELAIREYLHGLALESPGKIGVVLFEDHKIARVGFALPDNCRKVSTRAFLLFLEQRGWLESAAAVERRAILAGRSFSQIRFPAE